MNQAIYDVGGCPEMSVCRMVERSDRFTAI